jgi:hypothetical protein
VASGTCVNVCWGALLLGDMLLAPGSSLTHLCEEGPSRMQALEKVRRWSTPSACGAKGWALALALPLLCALPSIRPSCLSSKRDFSVTVSLTLSSFCHHDSQLA